MNRQTHLSNCIVKNVSFVLILLLLTLPVFSTEGYGAPVDDETRLRPVKPLLGELLNEQWRLWSSPFRMDKKKLLFWGGVALTAAYLINQDKHYQHTVHNFSLSKKWVRGGSPVITQLGSKYFNAGLVGALYLGGSLLRDHRLRETSRLTLKSLLHAMVISQVLKRVFRRQRPYVQDGVDRWFNGGKGTEFRSFPSGHTTAAWSVATVIAGRYRHKPVIPILCYSLATLAGLSRMTENKHWASDVLAGAVLGYAVGRFVLRKEARMFNVTPILSHRRVGVGVSYVF